MSTIKVDTIATRTGSGNITLSNNVASLTSAGAISGTNVAVNGGTGGQVATNFSSASTMGMKINDTNSGNLGGMLGFYSGSGAGTLRANIQNANNAGVHFSVGTGGSVCFTQTGYTAANALDDYEFGTFTPNPDVESTGTLTASGVSGNYTKIGRIVHYNFSFDVQAISGTANNRAIEIFGFPFTPSGAEPFPPITVRASGLGSAVEAVSGYYHKGSNKVRIEEFNGTTTSNLSDHVVVGSSFKVSFTTEHT